MKFPTNFDDAVYRKLKDRWEAIRRNKNYRRDWDTAFHAYVDRQEKVFGTNAPEPKQEPQHGFKNSLEEQGVARKWGLIYPPDYNDPVWNTGEDPDDSNLSMIFPDYLAVHVIFQKEKATDQLGGEDGYAPQRESWGPLKDGRYLTLKIDLTKPKSEIFAWIDYLYEDYISLAVPEKKRKVKGSSIDDFYWKAWDMHHNEGKSAWQITKELYPDFTSKYPQSWEIDENTEKLTPEDQKARSYLRKVERAIKKAQRAINSITPAV